MCTIINIECSWMYYIIILPFNRRTSGVSVRDFSGINKSPEETGSRGKLWLQQTVSASSCPLRSQRVPFATLRRRNEPTKIIRKYCEHTHTHTRAWYYANYVAHDTRPYTRVPTYTVPFVADFSLRYMFIITKYARADGVTTNRSTFQIGSGS